MTHVGDHAAGNLIQILTVVVFYGSADRKPMFRGDGREVIPDRLQRFFIDAGCVAEEPDVSGDVEDGGLARAIGKRRNGSVKGANAELDRFQIAERGLAVAAVGVKFERNVADVLLNEWNKSARSL